MTASLKPLSQAEMNSRGMAPPVASSTNSYGDVPGGGTSKEVKFPGPGNYSYSCSIHGENGVVHVLVPGV